MSEENVVIELPTKSKLRRVFTHKRLYTAAAAVTITTAAVVAWRLSGNAIDAELAAADESPFTV